MSRPALFLASLLVLNACAITRHAAPPPGLDPVPADSVVMLSPGTLPPFNAAPVATFTPVPRLEELSDNDLLKYYTVQAGQRGANHVSIYRVNGRRVVRAHYLRIPRPVAATPVDSAAARRPATGSSASPGGGGPVRVRGYCRRDGVCVRPHTRSRPGSRARPGGGSRSRGSRRRG